MEGFISRFTFYTTAQVSNLRYMFHVIGILIFWSGDFTVSAQLHFTEVTSQAGIHFQHVDGRSGEKYFVEVYGSGAAWFDYDRDGDIDLYLVNGSDLPGTHSDILPTNALYCNNGDGTFTDVTVSAKVTDGGYGFGCCVGDYDNDGFKDLYVTNFGANLLYRNNGDSTFTDVTEGAGVGDKRWGTSAAFADYDNDGHLDLFVANYADYQLENNLVCHRMNFRTYCPPDDFAGIPDALYRNNGDGTFRNITQEAEMFHTNGKGLGVAWGDYNNDGYPDLLVANDMTPDMLYRNNADGTFTDVALFVGVALSAQGVAMGGMGANFGDYDNDGWLDLVVTNFQDDPNSLHRNLRDSTFSDITYVTKFGGIGLPYVGWGVDFVDLDNDRHQDLFVVNGHVYDNIEKFEPTYTYAQQNHLFRNLRDGTFGEISDQCGPALRLKKVSRGAAFGDYDNDGDIDILITNSNQTPDLLRNDSINPNHWLIIETIGTQSNRDGIGARVKVTAGGMSQIREVKSGSSYLSQSDMRLHFGLGAAQKAVLVEIRWPSGVVDRFSDVKPNQFLQVTEGEEPKQSE